MKPRASLVPLDAVLAVAERMDAGAAKHGNSWLTRDDSDDFDAILRHLAAWQQGERTDEDGSHIAAVACRALLMLAREVRR